MEQPHPTPGAAPTGISLPSPDPLVKALYVKFTGTCTVYGPCKNLDDARPQPSRVVSIKRTSLGHLALELDLGIRKNGRPGAMRFVLDADTVRALRALVDGAS